MTEVLSFNSVNYTWTVDRETKSVRPVVKNPENGRLVTQYLMEHSNLVAMFVLQLKSVLEQDQTCTVELHRAGDILNYTIK